MITLYYRSEAKNLRTENLTTHLCFISYLF